MKIKLGLLTVLSLMVALSSCLKESIDNKTLVLFGEEAYIKTFEEVFGVGPDSLDIIPANIDTINDLIEPPDIRGTFGFGTLSLEYPHGGFQVLDSVSFRFTEQHHMMAQCVCLLPGLPEARSNEVYVKGKGDRFYAYFEIVQTAPPTVATYMAKIKLTQGVLLTGLLSGTSMSQAKLAVFNKEVLVLNPDEVEDSIVEIIERRTHDLCVYALTRN